MRTDRTAANNKPGSIMSDYKQRRCVSIDVAIPGDRNVIEKEAERILKYKDLTIKIQRMWNVKAIVTPVIVGGDWNRFRITSDST